MLSRKINSMLVDKNHQTIRSKCLAYKFSFTDIFKDINHGYKAALLKKKVFVAAFNLYGYGFLLIFEKVHRANACSLNIFVLFQLESWIILIMRTKFLLSSFQAKRVNFEIAIMNIFNNCIAGILNKTYFPLNESSSLY